MAFNDAFGLWGHFAFSSKRTHGRAIYESLLDSQGEAYSRDFNSLEQGKQYARAVTFATVQYQLDRAFNNRNPAKASDLLGELEKDFQVTPGPRDTLQQRRKFLSAMMLVSGGNSYSAIVTALQVLLGSDFVAFNPGIGSTTFPAAPSTTSVFDTDAAEPKQFKIGKAVSITGTPISVPYTLISESGAPIAGESYTIDPDPCSTIERITIASVSPSSFVATFSRSHEYGAIGVRPYSLWSSTRRLSTVVVSLTAAQSPETRRKINELMAKAMRGSSQWTIVSDQGTFILDQNPRNILDATELD